MSGSYYNWLLIQNAAPKILEDHLKDGPTKREFRKIKPVECSCHYGDSTSIRWCLKCNLIPYTKSIDLKTMNMSYVNKRVLLQIIKFNSTEQKVIDACTAEIKVLDKQFYNDYGLHGTEAVIKALIAEQQSFKNVMEKFAELIGELDQKFFSHPEYQKNPNDFSYGGWDGESDTESDSSSDSEPDKEPLNSQKRVQQKQSSSTKGESDDVDMLDEDETAEEWLRITAEIATELLSNIYSHDEKQHHLQMIAGIVGIRRACKYSSMVDVLEATGMNDGVPKLEKLKKFENALERLHFSKAMIKVWEFRTKVYGK